MSPLQVFVSVKDLLDQVFLKTHATNCSLQLRVCSFALLGCRILAKCQVTVLHFYCLNNMKNSLI